MTTKTKLSIFALAGIVAIAAIGSGMMFNSEDIQTTEQKQTQTISEPLTPTLSAPDNEPFPYETDFRTGVPILQATPLLKIPELAYVHEVKFGTYDYLWRAVDNGATPISFDEMKEFFDTFEENGNRYALTNNDGTTQYFKIHYQEPSIDLEHHWVKVFVKGESYSIDSSKALNGNDSKLLSEAIDRQYNWVMIEDGESLKQLLDTNGKDLSIDSKHYQVMYLGPLSEELNDPKIRAMNPVTPEEPDLE